MNVRYLKTLLFIPVALIIFIAYSFKNEGTEPWSAQQLIEPGQLSRLIYAHGADLPVIFNIGPAGSIKGSIEIGSPVEKSNLENFRKQLSLLKKEAPVVIYCGCCPFKNCPNIRPAFELLNEMGFKNSKLLDLPSNLKTDWIDRGYPMSDSKK
jgi:thiosulfate/3-mercaptopyruvate sulfurtransferase